MTDGDMDRKLDSLFQAYKEACPEIEGSPNFMPNLWQKIEARQSLPFAMSRFARLFVSAAVALCLVMSLFLTTPAAQGPAAVSYVEALDSEHPHELMAYADIDGSGEVQ